MPLDTHGRKLPIDMIPNVVTGTTVETEIDGRWHWGVEPQTRADSRVTFSRLERMQPRRAWVASGYTEPELFRRSQPRLYLVF